MKYKKLIVAISLFGILGASLAGFFVTAGNVRVRVISGAGGMPPDTSSGALLDSDADVVFTEPFSSLSNWESAKIIRRVKVKDGVASTFLLPRKYGLYLELDGRKILYDRLELTPYDVQKNPGPRGERGDWYIDINSISNEITFSIDRQAE